MEIEQTQDGTVLTRIIHDLANYKYSEETAATLAAQLMEGSTKETTIGVVSAPSVFVALRNMTVRSILLSADCSTATF